MSSDTSPSYHRGIVTQSKPTAPRGPCVSALVASETYLMPPHVSDEDAICARRVAYALAVDFDENSQSLYPSIITHALAASLRSLALRPGNNVEERVLDGCIAWFRDMMIENGYPSVNLPEFDEGLAIVRERTLHKIRHGRTRIFHKIARFLGFVH